MISIKAAKTASAGIVLARADGDGNKMANALSGGPAFGIGWLAAGLRSIKTARAYPSDSFPCE